MPALRSRPDARPMRIVYGAGAVAAVSVMAVGMFKPDFGATAEQPVNQDEATATEAQTPAASLETQQATEGARRVVRYVYLLPGESAPRGAQVISAEEAARRLGVDAAVPSNTQRSNNQQNGQPAAGSRPPAPSVRTRQSGGG